MMGIIGEYIGKLILNINKTPQYVIRETRNISQKDKSQKQSEEMKKEIQKSVREAS